MVWPCSQGGEDWQLAQHQADGADAGQRAAAAQAQGTALQQARARLALTAVPQTLPCREKERDQIRAFVEGCVTAGGPLVQASARLAEALPLLHWVAEPLLLSAQSSQSHDLL